MEIWLKRKPSTPTYTSGEITIEGRDETFPSIEDVERLDGTKVYGETAIPRGRYRILMNEVSPKFSQYPFYMETCKGRLPRLENVPNFSGVLIHCGRHEGNTYGCILLNDYKGTLNESKRYFKEFYSILASANEDIFINIE